METEYYFSMDLPMAIQRETFGNKCTSSFRIKEGECLSLSRYNKVPQTGCLKHKSLFPTTLETRKFQIKILCLVRLSSWFRHITSFCVLPCERSSVTSLFIRVSIPYMVALLSLTYLNLITFQRPHLQIPKHWWLQLQHINFGQGLKHSVHSIYINRILNSHC